MTKLHGIDFLLNTTLV